MMEGRRARRRMIAAVVLLTGLAAVAGGVALSRRSEPAPSHTATAFSSIPGPSAADEGYPTFETLEPGPRQTIVLATPLAPSTPRPPAPRRRPPPSGKPAEATAPQAGRDPAQRPETQGSSPQPGNAAGNPAGGPDSGTGPLGAAAGPDSGSTPPGPEPAAGPVVEAPQPAPSPVLTPPVPLEQPPLHPVLRATVLPGPGGLPAADQASVRGKVRLRLLIRADGTVARVDVLVSSDDPALDEAARQGLLRWRFAPARRDGVPVDAYLLLWVTFGE